MANFQNEKWEVKAEKTQAAIRASRQPDALEQTFNRIAEATQTKWSLRIGKEKGKEYTLIFTLGGAGVALFGLSFLKIGHSAFHGGFLGASIALLCSTWVGYHLATSGKVTSEKEEVPELDDPKWTKDLGNQSGLMSKWPVAQPSSERRVKRQFG